MKKKQSSETDNIVLFPKSRIVHPERTALHSTETPESLKEIKDAVFLVKLEKINQIMDVVIPLISQGMSVYGINMSGGNENSMKSCALMVDSIRSFLYRHFGLDHPMHKLADDIIGIENGALVINKINVITNQSNQANN